MRNRGFTLFELLVAGGLLSLLLTVILNLLLPSFRASSRASIRVDLQQRVSLSMESLMADLERCSASSVTVFPVQASLPSGLSMQRLEGFTSGGLQVWEPTLISYHWRPDAQRLVRESWSGGLPALSVTPVANQPVAPTPADFLLLANQNSGTEKLLADSVKQFNLVWGSRNLQISLAMERQPPSGGATEHFEMHRSFFFRNSY